MLDFFNNINYLLNTGHGRRGVQNFPLRCERPDTNLYYNYCNEDDYLGVTQVVRVFWASRRLKNAQKLKLCFSRQKHADRRGGKL